MKQNGVCAVCRVDVGECPECGTFWYRQGGKRIAMRPATEADAKIIRELQGRHNRGIVYFNELPNVSVLHEDR